MRWGLSVWFGSEACERQKVFTHQGWVFFTSRSSEQSHCLSNSCSPCSAGTNGFWDSKCHEKTGGQDLVWRWQLKAAVTCDLAAVGVIIQVPVPYQSYLLITYQPILKVFVNFLVSVFLLCTSLWPGTCMLAKGRGETCSHCHCRCGLSFLTGCSGIPACVFLPPHAFGYFEIYILKVT